MHVQTATANLGGKAQGTIYSRRAGLTRLLRFMRDEHGAPMLWQHVTRIAPAAPRNVTVQHAELQRLLEAAKPYMRCWLLLCSDLALRSGTAANVGPENFDPATGMLSFRTKHGREMTLPVTRELYAMLAPLQALGGTGTFVGMLHPDGTRSAITMRYDFARLRKLAKIERRVTLHDLRRSTAVKILDVTHDLRQVQATLGHQNLNSTLHYLDHRNTPVAVSMLELAKLAPTTEQIQ